MSVSTKFGLSLSALGVIGLSALLIPACGSSESAGPPGNSSSSGGGSGSGSGGGDGGGSGGTYCGAAKAHCCGFTTNDPPLPPGAIPNPECDDGDETQCAASTTCSIAASCGTTTAGACEAMANNTGTTKNFRMRRIILVAPSKLANGTVQNTVVSSGVDMQEPQCGEKGTGDFNWLLSFDTAANTLKTGGAPQCDTTGTPSCDPFTTGYCFVNKQVGSIAVAPVTAATTKAADGTYQTTPGAIPTLNVPIYFQGAIIVLPISNGALAGVKISADGNCIGSLNKDGINADCSDDYTACSKWLTDGSLTGYITLKQADQVKVSLLNETLCALLTADNKGPGGSCSKDASGNIVAKGNYCSNPPGPGGCQDSFWLAATFAASAVNINDGTGVPDCSGGGVADAAAE